MAAKTADMEGNYVTVANTPFPFNAENEKWQMF